MKLQEITNKAIEEFIEKHPFMGMTGRVWIENNDKLDIKDFLSSQIAIAYKAGREELLYELGLEEETNEKDI